MPKAQYFSRVKKHLFCIPVFQQGRAMLSIHGSCSPVCRINVIWKLVSMAVGVSACVWPGLQIAELERDGFMLSVVVLQVCEWEGRKPSVGKGGKTRIIVSRVGGK